MSLQSCFSKFGIALFLLRKFNLIIDSYCYILGLLNVNDFDSIDPNSSFESENQNKALNKAISFTREIF